MGGKKRKRQPITPYKSQSNESCGSNVDKACGAVSLINALIHLDAPAEKVKQRRSYNLAGVSFTPREIATEISKHIPGFTLHCEPDFRQAIADSWPRSIDDSHAREDWGWKQQFNLENLALAMLQNLRSNLSREGTPMLSVTGDRKNSEKNTVSLSAQEQQQPHFA